MVGEGPFLHRFCSKNPTDPFQKVTFCMKNVTFPLEKNLALKIKNRAQQTLDPATCTIINFPYWVYFYFVGVGIFLLGLVQSLSFYNHRITSLLLP